MRSHPNKAVDVVLANLQDICSHASTHVCALIARGSLSCWGCALAVLGGFLLRCPRLNGALGLLLCRFRQSMA